LIGARGACTTLDAKVASEMPFADVIAKNVSVPPGESVGESPRKMERDAGERHTQVGAFPRGGREDEARMRLQFVSDAVRPPWSVSGLKSTCNVERVRE